MMDIIQPDKYIKFDRLDFCIESKVEDMIRVKES
jgi:hypothetical protein